MMLTGSKLYRPQGCATTVDPGGPTVEEDTFTCAHCNTIVFVKPYAPPTDAGGACMMCMRLVCPTCAGQPCHPFEEKLRAMEARDKFVRSILG